jgi:AcrR family transcriptional regulator
VPRRPDPTIKPAIVDRVAVHLRDTPVESVSIRGIGRVLGTSAYPIVYHFGSREALLDAVVARLERGAEPSTLEPDADAAALVDWLLGHFGRLADGGRRLAARLAFELGSTESIRAHGHHRRHHERHTETIAAWCRRHGLPDPDAQARSALLHARGIQWGCLIDGDTVAADLALRAIGRGLEREARAASESSTETDAGRVTASTTGSPVRVWSPGTAGVPGAV